MPGGMGHSEWIASANICLQSVRAEPEPLRPVYLQNKGEMKKERLKLDLSLIELNEGQLSWLPKNPRTWTQTDIDKTAASIKQDPDFLEDRPLLVVSREDSPNLVVFAGNLRSVGARAARLSRVPCVLYSPEEDEDYETIRRRAMKDNGSFGQFDWDEVFSGPWGQMDLDAMGIGKAFQQGGDPFNETPKDEGAADESGEQPKAQEDDFDENADAIQVRCKPGDVWQLGEHRLMCGDSTDTKDILKLMNGEKADITITSPPYNAGYFGIPGRESTKKKYLNSEDTKTREEYVDFLIKNISLLLANSHEIFYNIGLVSGSKVAVATVLYKFREQFKDIIYWMKSNPVNAIARGVISSSTELVLCFGENNTRAFRHTDFGSGGYFLGVISGPVASSNEYAKIHKATFPIYLPSEIISKFSFDGDLVLDCFGGTGTTLIAAEQLGRRCFMMELEARYCDVILARWEKLTGKTASKVSA